MKAIRIIVLLMMFFSVVSIAQESSNEFKQISNEEVPGTILAAIENDFPGVEVKGYYALPIDLYEKHWSAKETKEDLKEGNDLTHYMVEFDADANFNKVVYDSQGVLLQHRIVIKDADLPTSITGLITSKYKDYTITKNKELVKTSKDGAVDHYKVTIENDKKMKTLIFNGQGELIKER